ANLRLTQKNRIGNNRGNGQMIAVANDVLHDSSLIALRRTIPSQPSLFEVRCVDDQRVAHELACRKALERMRRPCWGMRAVVHPDHAVAFRGLRPNVNRDQALGVGKNGCARYSGSTTSEITNRIASPPGRSNRSKYSVNTVRAL